MSNMFGSSAPQPMMNMDQRPMNWNGGMQQSPQPRPQLSPIPVRVVFSPEQISPQEVPTDGRPAIFPLSDGSRIIVKSLLPNGMFDEQIYVPQPRPQQPVIQENLSNGSSLEQFEQRLSAIEGSLNKVLGDLYGGNKTQNEVTGGAVE